MQLEGLEIQHKMWELNSVLRPDNTEHKIGLLITTYNNQLKSDFFLAKRSVTTLEKGEM